MILKKLFCIIALTLILASHSLAQNYNWITPGKTYLKMYVADDGVYRIGKTDFTNAGVPVTSIDPRTVKVFYKGDQIPIFFSGEADGVFNDNDFFDFFGQRNYGGLTSTYNENNVVLYTTNEYFNNYSDTSTYWIDWGGANGTRYPTSTFTTTSAYVPDFFPDTRHFEFDKIYFQGESLGGSDYNFLSTEKYRGEGWYWALLANDQSVTDTFSTPYLNTTGANATIRIIAQPQNRTTAILNEHKIQVTVNGNVALTVVTNDLKRIDSTLSFPSNLLLTSGVNTITCKYLTESGFPSGLMYFDLFEIKYPKSFRIKDNKLNFDLSSSTDTTSKQFKIKGYNSLNPINIFDVNNNIRITNFTSSGDTIKFTAKSNSKIELINSVITDKPFRIKQKQVPNLVANTNGADYLLVYNKLFQSQAEQLRAYRETHDNYRSVKAEIEDIYDIFNYGMENPVAVKNFVKHAHDTWQLPKLSFICLFGRGSLDPKQNSVNSVYYNNLVPVYGSPCSDGYFANLNFGSFFYYDQIQIGRIPAYYTTEAQTMVDKIITYENEDPAKWWKTFTYITGGYTKPEQDDFKFRSNFELNTYFVSPPICGDSVKIYRNDTGTATINLRDSIVKAINRGTLYVNFRGHAGSHDWEIMMNDPNTLNNGNKLPVVVSLTCFTGENAKTDLRGFGEKFMYLGGKGAIGFIGTTGWSFSSNGNNFGQFVAQTIKNDSTRTLGGLVKVAGSKMIADSGNFRSRNTVNSYNLLGDPAVKLRLPRIPEFSISNNDYSMSNEAPSVNEPAALTIYPKNFGLMADSCKIRFQLKKNNQNYSFKDTIYRSFKFLDTVKYNFNLDSSGIYSMVVTLDQANWYPLENKTNNTISINIPTKNNTFVPISPADNSVIFKDSVEFSGLNPNIKYGGNTVKTFMQLDTSRNFNSPVLRTFIDNDVKSAVTKFRTQLNVTANNTIYHWRTNSIINNDTAGWSKVQTFIYNNGTGAKNVVDGFINATVPVVLNKLDKDQYSVTDLYNTSFDGNEIRLNERTVTLFVRSFGSNGEEASYFSVGDKNIYIDAGRNTGLNLIKVKKLNGTILEFKNFKINNPSSSDELVSFLNTFDNTHYLMLLNASYDPGADSLTPVAKNKLRQFGSVYCDSIELIGYFHTWSFIGFLGATPAQASETYDPCCPSPGCLSCTHWTQSISTMPVTFKETYGTVSNIIGPASTWTDFSWAQELAPNASLSFDVIGIDPENKQTVLFTNVQSNNFTELAIINAYEYPKLNLLAKLSIDTVIGNQSPRLGKLKVNYTPASELIIEKNSLQVNSRTREIGNTNFTFRYHNAGYSFIYGTIVNVYNNSISDSNLILTDTVPTILKMDSARSYSNNFTTPSFRDSTKIFIYIKPTKQMNEFYTYNNSVDFNISASSKTIAATMVEVYGDGKQIKSGDYISKKPEIKIQTSLSSALPLSGDTTQISLKLNDRYVPYFIKGNVNPVLKSLDNDNLKLSDKSLYFYPELVNGTNKLTVTFRDDLNNFDTLVYDVIVSDELLIKDLYNFPNPMRTETSFMFDLAGSSVLNMLKIKIYTVSGKLIRELQYPVNLGSNQIVWDGKDGDGDFVANGTYLYKLVVDDEVQTETKVQKLVVLR